MTERDPTPLPEAYELANYLVGPFEHDIMPDLTSPAPETHPGLESWQVSYYEVALGALRAVAGQETIPEGWLPSPAQGAELYRDLAYQRKFHGMQRGLKQFISDYKTGRTTTMLRDDQQEVMDDLAASFEVVGTSGQITVKSATGTGKTPIMINLIRGLKHEEQPTDPVGAIILVPSKEILHQTIGAVTIFAPEIDLGVYYGDKKELKKVSVMTYRSFDLAVRRGILTRNMADVIVKDEEHESGGYSTSHSLDSFCEDPVTGHRKAVFGVSATPRETENLAHDKPLVEAIDRGILSPISVRECKTGATIHETKRDRFRTREEYTEGELKDLIDNDPRNEVIIKEVLSGLRSGRRVGVRCLPGGKLLHPNLLSERLRSIKTTIVDPYTGVRSSRRIRSVVIDGAMRANDRRLILRAFNNPLLDGGDGLDVVLFVDTLVRGWDSPIAKKIINGCPIMTWGPKEQLLGRITRPFYRMDGTPIYGEAVDIVDDSESGQVLFSDVINRYAPPGMRYIAGSVIGAGLRDPRRSPGNDEVFEEIPPEDIWAFIEKQETWTPPGRPLAPRRRKSDPEQAEVTTGGRRGRKPRAQSEPGAQDRSSARQRTVEDTIQTSPFDAAMPITDELRSDSVTLAAAAQEVGVDQDEIEDAIMSENIRVYKDDDGEYYLTRVAMRRIRNWFGD